MSDHQGPAKILFDNETHFGQEYYPLLIEQYKLYVEMADKISERRDKTNNLFLALMTLLFGIVGVCLAQNALALIYLVSGVGVAFCIVWAIIIESYRQLNSGKFKIIHLIETKLPIRAYDAEWEVLGRGKNKKLYTPLSKIENRIPRIFGAGFIILAILVCFLTNL